MHLQGPHRTLTCPPTEAGSLVPAGLVISRMIQLAGGCDATMDELMKKQKMRTTTNDARSAAAANCSPRRVVEQKDQEA